VSVLRLANTSPPEDVATGPELEEVTAEDDAVLCEAVVASASTVQAEELAVEVEVEATAEAEAEPEVLVAAEAVDERPATRKMTLSFILKSSRAR
jgi:hypothetical protein